jgi:hypothetical protein
VSREVDNCGAVLVDRPSHGYLGQSSQDDGEFVEVPRVRWHGGELHSDAAPQVAIRLRHFCPNRSIFGSRFYLINLALCAAKDFEHCRRVLLSTHALSHWTKYSDKRKRVYCCQIAWVDVVKQILEFADRSVTAQVRKFIDRPACARSSGCPRVELGSCLEQDGGQFSGLVAVEWVALAEVEDKDVRRLERPVVDGAVGPLDGARGHCQHVVGDLAVRRDNHPVRLRVAVLPGARVWAPAGNAISGCGLVAVVIS